MFTIINMARIISHNVLIYFWSYIVKLSSLYKKQNINNEYFSSILLLPIFIFFYFSVHIFIFLLNINILLEFILINY